MSYCGLVSIAAGHHLSCIFATMVASQCSNNFMGHPYTIMLTSGLLLALLLFHSPRNAVACARCSALWHADG